MAPVETQRIVTTNYQLRYIDGYNELNVRLTKTAEYAADPEDDLQQFTDWLLEQQESANAAVWDQTSVTVLPLIQMSETVNYFNPDGSWLSEQCFEHTFNLEVQQRQQSVTVQLWRMSTTNPLLALASDQPVLVYERRGRKSQVR